MHAKKHFEAVVGTSHSKSPKVPEKYILEMLRYEAQSDNILDDVSLCIYLDDGTYIMQHFWFSAKSSKVTCAFVKINENNNTFTTYLGEGNTSEDYVYLSLSSAKDISIDELSKDYSIDFVIKAENGKASYKKNEKSFS